MATYGTTKQYIKYSVNHQVISQDVAKNQSVVRVWVDIWRTNTGYTTYGSGTVTVTCAGQTKSASITPSQRITSTAIKLISHDFTVAHDANGSKTAYISGQISHAVFSSSSNGYSTTLPTIPRSAEITDFTCSSDYLDGTFSVSYSSKATFDYYLRLSIPNVIAVRRLSLGSQTAGNKTASASFSAEELETIYGYTKTASVQQIGAVIETYSGSTKVGESEELKLDLKIPEEIKPTIGSISTSVVDGFEGILLQGKSRLSFSVSGASGSHGSTIASYSVKGGDFVYSGALSTCETGVITQSGEIDYLVTVTDSRGRTASETVTVEVSAYSRPSLTAEVYRSTSTGEKDYANGRYITIIPTFSISDVEGNSIASRSIRINGTLKSSSFASGAKRTYGTYSLNTEYEVVVSITDAVGNTTTVSTVIGIAKIPMNIPPHKNGIGFGRYCSEEGEAQFDYDVVCYKRLRVSGPVDFSPSLIGGASIASGADLDGYMTPGNYACMDSAAQNVDNSPVSSGFRLEVGYVYTDAGYIYQMLTDGAYGDIWYRRHDGSSWGQWEAVARHGGRVLAAMGWYMNENQSATFSEPISKQNHGIVLEFCQFDPATQTTSYNDISSFFVDKSTVALYPGKLHSFVMFANSKAEKKVLYITDTTITGHVNNSGSSTEGGVTFSNTYSILNKVYGV